MIKIIASQYTLKITGHEINDERYKLVCCAVSAISWSGINSFKKTSLRFFSTKGILKATLKNRNYKNKIMWKMLINQLYLLYLQNKQDILWLRKDK